jgi:hypothetical protein
MGGLFIAVAWILAVYLVPALLNKRVEARVEKRQSDYQLELEKLEMLMPFEEETKALVEKARRQYKFFGELYNRVRKEIKTKEGFWTLINELEKRDTITQDEREILGKLGDTLKEKGDLDYEQIKTETYKLYLKVYTEGNQILSNRGRLYLEQEFPKIQAKENELLKQIESDVDFFQGLFSLIPTTFYLSTGNEIGSRGYENTIDFYKNAITTKNEFLWFYIEHRYAKRTEKIKDFIKMFKKKLEGKEDAINLEKEFWEFYKLYKNEEASKKQETSIYQGAAKLPGKFGLEIFGQRFTDIIKFYEDVIKIKKEFRELYVILREGKYPGKIVNFIEVFKEKVEGEKEANIFYASSRLPGKFGWGIVITGLWVSLAWLLSYLFFKKAVFHRPKEQIVGLSDLEIELNKGESNVVLSSNVNTISQHLYNVLAGKNIKMIMKKRGFWGKVVRDGINFAEKKTKTDFVYLFHPDEMPPDISPWQFFLFIGRTAKMKISKLKEIYSKICTDLNIKKEEIKGKNFGQLRKMNKDVEILWILFEAARLAKTPIYMMNNFAKGMPLNFIEKFAEELEKLREERGVSILYLTNDVFIGQKIGDYISFLKQDAELVAVTM